MNLPPKAIEQRKNLAQPCPSRNSELGSNLQRIQQSNERGTET